MGKNNKAGFALVLVLLMLFLSASVATTTAYMRYQSALKARQTAKIIEANLLQTTSFSKTLYQMYGLLGTVRSRAKALLRPSAPYLTSADLNSLATNLQTVVDGTFCSQTAQGVVVRVYFTNVACGQPLPQGYSLANPTKISPSSQTQAEIYSLPFLIYLEVNNPSDEIRNSKGIYGSIKLLAGQPSVSYYQLFLSSSYQSDGTPSYFWGSQVWEGPVYVAAPPFFGNTTASTPGPYFLGGLSTALCPSPNSSGCAGSVDAPFFKDVGKIAPDQMHPSPFEPCYGPSCPKLGGGVDWSAPARATPAPNLTGIYVVNASDNPTVDLSPDPANPRRNRIIVYRQTGANETYYFASNGLYNGSGNFISATPAIYFRNGKINLSGPVGAPAWRTNVPTSIFADGDIQITGNLFSDNPPCRTPTSINQNGAVPADCADNGTSAMLGIASMNGDIIISGSSPENTYIHASLLAPNGSFRPETYPSPVKSLSFLGTLAALNYDDFYRWQSQSGWVLRTAYDPRMRHLAPIAFPRLPLDVWGAYLHLSSKSQ